MNTRYASLILGFVCLAPISLFANSENNLYVKNDTNVPLEITSIGKECATGPFYFGDGHVNTQIVQPGGQESVFAKWTDNNQHFCWNAEKNITFSVTADVNDVTDDDSLTFKWRHKNTTEGNAGLAWKTMIASNDNQQRYIIKEANCTTDTNSCLNQWVKQSDSVNNVYITITNN